MNKVRHYSRVRKVDNGTVRSDRLPFNGERLMHGNQYWKSNVIEGSLEYSLICRNYFKLVIFHNIWRYHTKVI